jgi:3-deoxy-D-manno-octulosonate 8-phosphate phosphatase (KDO 8-P phosphatase)
MALNSAAIKARAKKIRCVFIDIDGVMTNCKLYLTHDGEELKAVNVRDGYGMKALLQAGIQIAVISGRPSVAMQKRLEWLGIPHIYLDTEHKIPAYEEVKKKLGISDAQCAHIGDDVPDLPLFERVGLSMCPSDAHPRAQKVARWKSRCQGGDGAIREAADLILAAQGLLK